MTEKYYLIRNDDGDTYITEIDPDGYIKELVLDEREDQEFVTQELLKEESDTNYWGNKELIIKGEIVAPYVVKKIAEMRLP